MRKNESLTHDLTPGAWRRLARLSHLGTVAAALAVAGPAAAQQAPGGAAPANVVSLSATASAELPMDWLTVVFSTTREGPDAAAVQSQLRQALDAALSEARRAAKPGEVLVRTGGFAVQPRYATRGNATNLSGWQGHAELVVEGRDTASIAQMMGRLPTLTIGRVGWSLSREAREKVEADVTAQAIARFRKRADELARHFGMSGYTLREVNVSGNEPGPPVVMMRAQAMRAGAPEESLPVEAGRALVSATVSGTVQLK